MQAAPCKSLSWAAMGRESLQGLHLLTSGAARSWVRGKATSQPCMGHVPKAPAAPRSCNPQASQHRPRWIWVVDPTEMLHLRVGRVSRPYRAICKVGMEQQIHSWVENALGVKGSGLPGQHQRELEQSGGSHQGLTAVPGRAHGWRSVTETWRWDWIVPVRAPEWSLQGGEGQLPSSLA